MFITDSQTISDVGIFNKGTGIYELFNRALTRGGAQLLEEFLRYPLSNAEDINRRTGIIKYFSEHAPVFPFETELFDAAEQYLINTDERTKLAPQELTLGRKLSGLVTADNTFKEIQKGVVSLIELLRQASAFILGETAGISDYRQEREQISGIVTDASFKEMLQETSKGKLSYTSVALYDVTLRFRERNKIKKLLQHLYRLDTYLSIAKVAKEQGYEFAAAHTYTAGIPVTLSLTDVKHPLVKGAKGNDIVIGSGKNAVFLTGANMAGKSTFMKSVGIAVYLAHCGLPVAASSMSFTVMDGMFSTINLPDNLGMGASHFYAEVLRVKKVAKELHEGKRLFVLFDELFRGTNVKDAQEATVAVIEGFAKKKDSLFVVSTHIIEAGEILMQKTGNIQYRFLPTKMDGHKPVYTYTLEEGITEDRHGMVIIRNEKIIEMLENNAVKQ